MTRKGNSLDSLKRSVLASLVATLLLVLASCSGGQDTSGSSSGGDPESTLRSEPATPDGTTAEEAPSNESTTEDNRVAATFALPGENIFPEGIAVDGQTGDFFVGSTVDGTIYRGNAQDTSGELEVFLEPGADGRESVTGMSVDDEGRLWIAGRFTGRAFVYDIASRELIRTLETPSSERTILNDVIVTQDAAYITDSFRPTLFRVPATNDGVGEVQPWLDLDETPVEYGSGFNLNGIAASENGRYLITVHYDTGELYRIDTESEEVVQIDLGGEAVTTGDGIVLDETTLYVVRNQPGDIVPVELSEDLASGEVGASFSDPSLAYPTTAAMYDGRLLVVNSQFSRQGGEPDLPFTVSSVPIP